MTNLAEKTPRSHSAAPVAGETIAGKYRVEHVLGAGGMGVVVAATHLNLDERFAIKMLLPELTKDEDLTLRFLREGRAAIKIRNEHVVRIHDVDTLESGVPYMVMEYLDGRDLDAVMVADGPMPIANAVDLLLQACEAISEAHSLGIVHRDIKPANLFLTQRADGSPSIKVLDFGISKMVARVGQESRVTKTAAIMGSPHYMSPEQLKSTHNVDGRTDIWALGVVMHELLTGKSPFDGITMPEICANILKEPPVALRTVRADVPEGLESVVLRCLEKDVEQRFENVASLAMALAPFGTEAAAKSAEHIVRVLQAAGVEVDENGASPDARPYTTSRKVAARKAGWSKSGVVLAVVAGVLLGVAGGGTAIRRMQDQQSTVAAPARPSDPPPPQAQSLPAPLPAPPALAAVASPVITPPTLQRVAAPAIAPRVAPAKTYQPTPAESSPSPDPSGADLFDERK